MRQEYGLIFVALLAGALLWWFKSQTRAGMPYASTDNTSVSAGNVTPEVPTSNTPMEPKHNAWFPYYLVSNYPSNRGGDNVMPSLVVGGLAEYYGPQEILPQF